MDCDVLKASREANGVYASNRIEKFPPTGEIFCKDQPSFMKHMTSTDSTHHYEFQAEGGDLVKLLD